MEVIALNLEVYHLTKCWQHSILNGHVGAHHTSTTHSRKHRNLGRHLGRKSSGKLVATCAAIYDLFSYIESDESISRIRHSHLTYRYYIPFTMEDIETILIGTTCQHQSSHQSHKQISYFFHLVNSFIYKLAIKRIFSLAKIQTILRNNKIVPPSVGLMYFFYTFV